LTTSTLARNTDPATSQDAVPVEDVRNTQALTLLRVFTNAMPHAMIAADASYAARLTDGGWKRVSDLKRAGYVAPALGADDRPLTIPGPSGRKCALLKATEAGLRAVRENTVRV
jgi:hypothetical protein